MREFTKKAVQTVLNCVRLLWLYRTEKLRYLYRQRFQIYIKTTQKCFTKQLTYKQNPRKPHSRNGKRFMLNACHLTKNGAWVPRGHSPHTWKICNWKTCPIWKAGHLLHVKHLMMTASQCVIKLVLYHYHSHHIEKSILKTLNTSKFFQ